MHPSLLLPCALAALTLPPGWGLAAPLLGRVLRVSPTECLGLLLLALAPMAPGLLVVEERAATATAGAVLLQGRWRSPPAARAYLATAAGPVHLRWASEVDPPAPGTPVQLAVRVRQGAEPLAVARHDLGPPRGAWLDRWAATAARRIDRLVGRDRRGLVDALLLGRRSELPFPVLADCIDTGTVHLLALSGLHASLLLCVVGAVCKLTGRNARAAGLVALAAFLALAGPRAPLVRATLGAILAICGARTGRQGPSLLRLAAVALAMAAWAPGWHRDLSAQLSFLAVAGLMAMARQVRGPLAFWVVPAGAFLATAPLCAETFGRVQPLGVLWTPLLVPLVGAVLALGLVAVLPGPLLACLDPITGPLLDAVASLLQAGLAVLAHISPAPLTPAPLALPGALVSLGVVGLLLLPRGGPGNWIQRWVP